MMNGLRMIWVISRHYNCEERMAPLMETIANTLVRISINQSINQSIKQSIVSTKLALYRVSNELS